MSLEFVVITDFDGTATGVAGKELVFSPFYKSLLVSQTGNYDYKNTPMLSSKEIQAKFKAEFDGNRQDPRLISQEAEHVFRLMCDNPNTKLCINTKNRAAYIKEMLTYLGFTAEQMDNITIKDSGNKKAETKAFLNELGEEVDRTTQVMVLDDVESDLDEMFEAAAVHKSLFCENVIYCHRPAGLFSKPWQKLVDTLRPSLKHDRAASKACAHDTNMALSADNGISYAFALNCAGTSLIAVAAIALLATGIGLAAGVSMTTASTTHVAFAAASMVSAGALLMGAGLFSSKVGSDDERVCYEGVYGHGAI